MVTVACDTRVSSGVAVRNGRVSKPSFVSGFDKGDGGVRKG